MAPALLLLAILAPALDDQAAADLFEARVRPVLIGRCQRCHGPAKQQGGLRLDSRAAMLAGGDSGPAVEPGDPDASPLIEAIRHDGAIRMPPDGRLDDLVVADLVAWVAAGAPWPEAVANTPAAASPTTPEAIARARVDHWAYRPVVAVDPPTSTAARSPIDAFLLARLEAGGLGFAPPADRRTLIRRATFDLIGLPPTPEEVEAFVADPSADAYEGLLDRLLASPHYGERMARSWLDVARYADTKGYVLFEEPGYPFAWTYRDYVIRSFNDDLPYDRFLVEQIAADRLELGDDRRPLAALGFLTVGGRFMGNPHDVIDDRIDVVTRGLMGLAVSCARCHDHKFDPVPTDDYYALYGVFASTVEPNVPPLFEPPPATPEYAEFARELAAREAKLNEYVATKRNALAESARRRADDYLLAAAQARGAPRTDEFMLIADGDDLNPTMIVRWQSMLDRSRRGNDPIFAPWHELAELREDGFAAGASALSARLAGPADPARPINGAVARALAASPPATLAEAAATYGRLLRSAALLRQDADRRAALNGQPSGPLPDADLDALARVVCGPDTPPEIPTGPAGDLALVPDRASQGILRGLLTAVEQHRSTGPGAPPRAMAVEDRAVPVDPRVFVRGNPSNLGPAAPRRFLAVLAGPDRRPFAEGSGRLELARAIASADNPLTARVAVNRLWAQHFGRGLVDPPGDFGARGEPPSHPELLDWLAARFVAGGWSTKAIHRAIMLSDAYQQSSSAGPAPTTDPENRLLSRQNRRRLDFEPLRDALLAVSGRLDPRVGGPSIADLVAPDSNRRTLYGSIDRLNLPGHFRTFDFPDPSATSPGRAETIVPPQSLFLMNHPFALACARSLADRPDLAGAGPPVAQVDRLFRLLLGRPPDAAEARLALDALGPAADASARARLAQALLFLNEFAYID